MSSNTSNDQHASHGCAVNAGIDSSLTPNLSHRGSLTPPELDSIHQTNSFKKALELQEEDNREIAAKNKLHQKAEKLKK